MTQTFSLDRPHTRWVAIIMERAAVASPWGGERWSATGAVCDGSPPGTPHRTIVRTDELTQILFPGCEITLRREEAEGYYLNITSPHPVVFVLWRMRDEVAWPELLTVSYHEGARWIDGGETVDGVPLPPELLPWIAQYVAENYRPEPKKPPRYASSKDKGVASRR